MLFTPETDELPARFGVSDLQRLRPGTRTKGTIWADIPSPKQKYRHGKRSQGVLL